MDFIENIREGRSQMNKYDEILQTADKKYNYSELEKNKIISLLECCNANDVRMTPRRMYELFFL